MVRYYFDVDDKDETTHILLRDELVDVANHLSLILTISYKKFGEPRYQPKPEGYKVLEAEEVEEVKKNEKSFK